MNPISQAINEAGGVTALARACNVTPQAVRKWEKNGKLPRTEWTGETNYSYAIEQATHGVVGRKKLLNRT